MRRALTLLLVTAALVGGAVPASAVLVQTSSKLAPYELDRGARFGTTVALSADGQTALVGAPEQDGGVGAVWVYTRAGDGWTPQGPPLTPGPGAAAVGFGQAVALSADGDTALVGAPLDADARGSAWVFTRAQGAWSQPGAPLTPANVAPDSLPRLGSSVALSADGDTALVGGPLDYPGGAAWVFQRADGTWTQDGSKLRADDQQPGQPGMAGAFGTSVALSGDGDTALVGAPEDAGGIGGAWLFDRGRSRWRQAGSKLAPSDEVGAGSFGGAVALDGSGDTALLGAWTDDSARGAAWSFDRSGAQWLQSGPKLVDPNGGAGWLFGFSVAFSAGGDAALVGSMGVGAAALFRRGALGWSVDGTVAPSDAVTNTWSRFGAAVALTPDAATLLVGGDGDGETGAAWTFGLGAAPLTVPILIVPNDGSIRTPGSVPGSASIYGGDQLTGTLTFRLYGPDPSGCIGQPAQIATVPVDHEGTYFPGTMTVTQLGAYELLIAYSGDERNAPLSSRCGEGHVEVRSDVSLRVDVEGSREVGAPLTLAPAFVGGFAPSGDVLVDVYGPSDPMCFNDPLVRQTVRVHDGRIPVVTLVPAATGRLMVTAFYEGDENNLLATFACRALSVEIERAGAAIAATASAPVAVGGAIGAGARVEGFHASGTVTFLLYPSGDPTCSRRPLATVDARLVDGVAQSQSFATAAAGTYHLTATYAGDRNNRPAASPCAAGAVTASKARPTLSLAASASRRGTLTDAVVLHGGFRPRGNVRFTLFGRRDRRCRRRPVFTVLMPLGSDAGATTPPFAGARPGRYQFVVRYGGDDDNEAAQSACGANPVEVPRARHRSRRRTRVHHAPSGAGRSAR